MKILQLTNKVPYPPRDGGAIASLALATGLAKAGNQVLILAMNTSKHFVETHNHASLPPNIRLETVFVDTKIRVLRALANLLFSRLPYNAVRFHSDAYRNRLREILTKEPFDFIILENLYTCLYRDVIEEFPQVGVLLRPHNVEHEIWKRTSRSAAGPKRWYLAILTERIKRFELAQINRYTAIIPISERDSRQFKSFGNARPMHVLPTGIDLSNKILHGPGIERMTVGHLGALDWIPNQNGIRWFLGQVWPLIKNEVPEAEFHLAGRNAPTHFINEVTMLGAHFHGEIPDAEVFVRDQCVMVVPLFSGSGMRIKLLEYLSWGMPVVATTIGAEGVELTPGVEALIADRPDDFAQSVITLLRSPGHRLEIGEKAINFVKEKYDNTLLIKNFTDFISGVS